MGSKKRVVVVGGGIAGLGVAHALMPQADVTVLEAGDRAGGLLLSESIDGFLCEHAASSFLDNLDGGATDLCRELGVPLVPASDDAKRRWVFRRGKLRVVPMGLGSLLTTSLISVRGKLRALMEPLVGRGPSGDQTVGEFFRRRLGSEVAAALAGPFVTGIYAGDADQLSLAAAFPKLFKLENEHGGIVRGMIKGGGKQKGKKKRRAKLLAPLAGVAALPKALAKKLGDRVRCGAPVAAAAKAPGGVSLSNGENVAADHVVMAVPAHVAAEFAEPHDDKLAKLLRGLPMVSVAVAHVAFSRDEIKHKLDGFGFLCAREPGDDEHTRCLGCVIESTVWENRAPQGQVLFRLIYGGAWDPGAVSFSDDEILRHVKEDLGKAFGIEATPRLLRVVRHAHAIAQYQVGHVERVAEIEELAAKLGWTMAGSAYHGISVNDCVSDAARVAQAALL